MPRLLLVLLIGVLTVVLAACAARSGQAVMPMPATDPGAQGWLLCLSTDRPIYHPGDVVNGRVVILDAVTFAPTAPRMPISLRLLDPQGKSGTSDLSWSTDSIAAFTWTLPRDVAEGGYRITADTASAPATPAERAIIITTEHTPALDLDLLLAREAWVPGETASARLRVRQHDGKPVPGVQVRTFARVDGQEIPLTPPTLDANGETTVQVPLPTTFTSGVLTVTIDDGGRLDQLARPLRRLSQPLVDLVPESGTLLADVANVVYLQARWRSDQPLTLRGVLMDDQQQRIAEVVTTHEGRARLSFTPRAERRYHLSIREPVGISTTYPLPAVSTTGVVLHARDEQIAAGAPARLELLAAGAGTYRIDLTRRGAAMASTTITCIPGVTKRIDLPLPTDLNGVLEATVYDANQTAVAQRLLFRVAARRLSLTVINHRPRYGLDENATVTVQVRDEAGQPVAALVSVAVIDAGLHSAVPARERAPRLPVMALLENEVEICADPAVYLNDPHALDLLLGTQGWRQLRDASRPPSSTTPVRDLALRRLLMSRRPLWPTWPAMLPAEANAPVPALSTRHQGRRIATAPPSDSLPTVPPPPGVVDEGFRWTRWAQRADGAWSPSHPADVNRYDTARTGTAAWSGPDADRATTALMVLAYLGAGYDHLTPSKYKKVVGNGLAWLSAQAPDGRFSDDASVQGVVTSCLAEAYAMTNDQKLKPLCESAVAVILADQVHWQGQRLGWAATTSAAPVCDADASWWCVSALKSGLAGGLAIGDGMMGAKAYVTAAWTAANAGRSREDTATLATFPARWDPRSGACHQPHSPAQGVAMSVFLGFHAGHPLAEGLINHTYRRYYPPVLPLPLIDNYLASIGIFQHGGERWERWNESYRSLLIDLQEDATSPLRGSWDPQLFDAVAATGGRPLTTAFAYLSLEFYYRFKSVDASGAVDAATAAPPPAELDAGTRYWNAALRTDPVTGTATLHFKTPLRSADLHIVVDAVDARGALGSGDGLLRCGTDLTLTARLPQHLRVGDTALIPLSVRDRRTTPAMISQVRLDEQLLPPLTMQAGVGRTLVPLIANTAGSLPLRWSVTADGLSDALQRTIPVGHQGFPWEQHHAGMVTAKREETPVIMPIEVTTASRRAIVTVYPSPAARLLGAVAGLLQEPHGCFEQISATSYPLAQAQGLVRGRATTAPALLARMKTLLQDSYQQLIAYEVPGGGFSWYGKAPAHPALTAFGLMQFRELCAILPVDRDLLARTRAWLLASRDAHGVFTVADDLPEWGRACANSYITWALLESADDAEDLARDVSVALDAVENDARSNANSYVVALAANALLRGGRADAGRAALARLIQAIDGSIDGATASLLSHHPDDARQQATALALLAWSRFADPAAQRERAAMAARYLLGRCVDGAFGTTQTTVLTLRALQAYDAQRQLDQLEPVTLTIAIDGQDLPDPLTIAASADDPIAIDLTAHLPTGEHRLTLRQSGKRQLPWALALSGTTAVPSQHADGFALHVALDQQPRYTLGASATIKVTWKIADELPSPIALIGIPGGLRPLRAALDDLMAKGRISAWEQTGDLLVLYWTEISERSEGLSIPCVAEVPGTFTGPPSRLYPYYAPHQRAWSAPLSVTIDAPPGW